MKIMFRSMLVLFIIGIVSIPNALAVEITVLGGWNHTNSSTRGDGSKLGLRIENPIVLNDFGVLSLAGEFEDREGITFDVGQLSGEALLGELIYYPHFPGKIKPYIFGGAGYSWWNFDRNQDMVNRGIFIDTGDAFIYKVGLGAFYEIDDNWSVGVEWSYDQIDIPKDAHYANGSFSNVFDTGKTIGEGETALMALVKYRF